MDTMTADWKNVLPFDRTEVQAEAARVDRQTKASTVLRGAIPLHRDAAMQIIGDAWNITAVDQRSDVFYVIGESLHLDWRNLDPAIQEHVLQTVIGLASDFRTAFKVCTGEDYNARFQHADPL